LAVFGFIICAGAAFAFAALELPAAPIAVFAGLAIIAVVDVFVIISRKRHDPGRPDDHTGQSGAD
jgi:hypothetical protein